MNFYRYNQGEQGEFINEIQSILIAHGYETEWTTTETNINHGDFILGLRFINVIKDYLRSERRNSNDRYTLQVCNSRCGDR
ncbi:Uncharacterised protein [Paenibacillus polymyxa]|uniref:Uncharacterized protein n=1 Tax=Paenibacillus polymyxa TaxID=1406 RepID=A0A378Y043_PAEPO|nr:Uncharacterised protein [Paenibacillus polymyxa]